MSDANPYESPKGQPDEQRFSYVRLLARIFVVVPGCLLMLVAAVSFLLSLMLLAFLD